jgi:hypothetical protein
MLPCHPGYYIVFFEMQIIDIQASKPLPAKMRVQKYENYLSA